MRKIGGILIAAATALAGWAPARAGEMAAFRDLRRDLISGGSATLVLQSWCARDRLADPPRVVALRDSVETPADSRVRRLLGAGPGEAVAYRRVRLACGGHVLSTADNWYLPDRLTPDMNRRLETTREPFGLVVAPVGFRRETLSVRANPVALRRDRSETGPILTLEAVLRDRSGHVFALVREAYSAILIRPR